MADDSHDASNVSDEVEFESVAKEDAETSAARRELKQTSISEKGGEQKADEPNALSEDETGGSDAAEKPPTPELLAKNDELKDQVGSPKKKRAHDQLDEPKEITDLEGTEDAAPSAVNGTVPASRTDRSEPEKKRPRDEQGEEITEDSVGQKEAKPTTSTMATKSPEPKTTSTFSFTTATATDKPATSASAFASSGFAKLGASAASPFSALGGTNQNVFGGASTGSASPFGAVKAITSPPPAPPKLSFGSTAASPFASASANGQSSSFGGALSSGFGNAFSGPRLMSFAKPGGILKSDKPAKPFGAPESDGEDEEEDVGDEDKDDGSADEDDTKDEKDTEESSVPPEDKKASDDRKKPKLQKVDVDDGEAGETTLLSVRAKMYHLEKGTGWKERGGGMLKVNVPTTSIDFTEDGDPIPSSFDASTLGGEEEDDEDEDEEGGETKGHRVVRLVMRQDHTLRVILNTAIVPAMDFQERDALKATTVLFTAFDEGEPKPVQMKMSKANASLFTSLITSLKRELVDALS